MSIRNFTVDVADSDVFPMLSSLRSLLEDYISPLSVKLRGGGGCFWVVSLYILMYHSSYRVALAQENKRVLLLSFGCYACKTITNWDAHPRNGWMFKSETERKSGPKSIKIHQMVYFNILQPILAEQMAVPLPSG